MQQSVRGDWTGARAQDVRRSRVHEQVPQLGGQLQCVAGAERVWGLALERVHQLPHTLKRGSRQGRHETRGPVLVEACGRGHDRGCEDEEVQRPVYVTSKSDCKRPQVHGWEDNPTQRHAQGQRQDHERDRILYSRMRCCPRTR